MLKQDPHERPSSSQLLTEPIISAHVSSLRKRLHNKKRERSVSSASSQASVESGQSNRKMTARERMRSVEELTILFFNFDDSND